MNQERRRLTLAGILVLALVAISHSVGAQQARIYRIGVVLQGGSYSAAIGGVQDGLRELGFEEGKQFRLHVRGNSKARRSTSSGRWPLRPHSRLGRTPAPRGPGHAAGAPR